MRDVLHIEKQKITGYLRLFGDLFLFFCARRRAQSGGDALRSDEEEVPRVQRDAPACQSPDVSAPGSNQATHLPANREAH